MDEVRPELELFVRGKLYAQQFTLESLGVTAIIALNDLLATGISLGLQDEGIDVPRDVSVVGIDDVLMAQMTCLLYTSYVPDLHRRMLLATLWNTYICINEALALTLSDFSLVPPYHC